eukprot:m.99411 g.99411  ORF g.99411 m.99411 type:complete len:62 (-) comp27158_c0_seq1:210-395(-)
MLPVAGSIFTTPSEVGGATTSHANPTKASRSRSEDAFVANNNSAQTMEITCSMIADQPSYM